MDKTKGHWQEVVSEGGEFWKPEEGEVLEGEYVSVKASQGSNNSNLYTIKKDDGSLIDVWGSAVLDDRMFSVSVGSLVSIEFKGTKPNRISGRNPIKIYVVKVCIDM